MPSLVVTNEKTQHSAARFEPTDLKKIEGEGNIYVFTNSNGQRAVLSKVRQKTMYYHDAF